MAFLVLQRENLPFLNGFFISSILNHQQIIKKLIKFDSTSLLPFYSAI